MLAWILTLFLAKSLDSAKAKDGQSISFAKPDEVRTQ
jgi:hypothetical protein